MIEVLAESGRPAISSSRLRAVEEMMRTSTLHLGGAAGRAGTSDRPARAGSCSGSRAACRAISSMNSVPPWRFFERARLARAARRSICSMPNSSTSMRSGVIAAALMTTNGPSARLEGVMQRARRQFLAGAGGTDDQDAAVGLGGAFDGLAQLVHAGGAPGQHACGRSQLLELLHLALEAARSPAHRVATRISRSDLNGFSMKS